MSKQCRTRLKRSLPAYMYMKPAFIIIGAQRSGTTSLYNYMIEHPRIVPASKKEIHFFDNHFTRGITWYRRHFPSRLSHISQPVLTGEASPFYMFHPLAATRIQKQLPAIKLIVLLRNPIDRAYSHYQHVTRKGQEPLSFEEAISAEPDRLRGERERLETDPTYFSFAYQYHSYLARGIYADILGRWFALFPREQFLILNSEHFYAEPSDVMYRVFAFLGIPGGDFSTYRAYNQANYADMASATRAELAAYFAPHNQRLYDLLGVDFGWEMASHG